MPDASPIQTVSAAVILLAVLAGVFFLAYHGTISGDAALGVVGTIVGAGVGTFAHQSGAKVGARAASEAKQ